MWLHRHEKGKTPLHYPELLTVHKAIQSQTPHLDRLHMPNVNRLSD